MRWCHSHALGVLRLSSDDFWTMGPDWFWSLAEHMAERAQEDRRMADYRAGVIASQVSRLVSAYGGTALDPHEFFASLDPPEQDPAQMAETFRMLAEGINQRNAQA